MYCSHFDTVVFEPVRIGLILTLMSAHCQSAVEERSRGRMQTDAHYLELVFLLS